VERIVKRGLYLAVGVKIRVRVVRIPIIYIGVLRPFKGYEYVPKPGREMT